MTSKVNLSPRWYDMRMGTNGTFAPLRLRDFRGVLHLPLKLSGKDASSASMIPVKLVGLFLPGIYKKNGVTRKKRFGD